MQITTTTSRLTTAPLAGGIAWQRLQQASTMSAGASDLPVEQLLLSEKAKAAGTASRTRLSQLSALSDGLTGRQVQQTATHATPVDHDHDHGHEPEAARRSGTSGRISAQERRRYAFVQTALESGRAVGFRNGNGETSAITLRQNRNVGGHASFTMGMGHDRLEVQVPQGADQGVALGRVADYYSQQKENLRGALDTIRIEAGGNPQNEYWGQKYGIKNFRSAATGGGGKITFYEGLSHLKESVFNHEFGHNVGAAVRVAQDREARRSGQLSAMRRLDAQSGDDKSGNVPRGQSRAIAADGRSVSSYGDSSVGEDFAEFFETYREAEERGSSALGRLARQYPNRFALLQQQVFSRHLDTAR